MAAATKRLKIAERLITEAIVRLMVNIQFFRCEALLTPKIRSPQNHLTA